MSNVLGVGFRGPRFQDEIGYSRAGTCAPAAQGRRQTSGRGSSWTGRCKHPLEKGGGGEYAGVLCGEE